LDIPKTVGAALAIGRRALTPLSETPGLDVQMLLSEAIGRPRAWVLAHPEVPIEAEQAAIFMDVLGRCQAGEALPHVLGWWEFYGRVFQLSSSVLIPRPETELLVETALAQLSGRSEAGLALDVGTGSGCIAVTLALEVTDLRVVAGDLSMEALQVARKNACAHGVEVRVHLLQADLSSPLKACFDLVCANLPYIPSAALHDLAVSKREPHMALDGGEHGLRVIERLLAQLSYVLAPQGCAILELGAGQGARVMASARRWFPRARLEVRMDLAGLDRLLVIRPHGEHDGD
jgi:release factor glutamine methyltransferase